LRTLQMITALAVALGTFPSAAGAAPPAPEPPFVADGEVDLHRGSAAYDATRVRGPSVNMALTKDGAWGGKILQQDVRLEVTPDRISGAGVNLVVKRDATSISVEGLFAGTRVRVKATRDTLVALVGQRQVEATRGAEGFWYRTGGATNLAVVELKGTANKLPDVPMPQWIFALMGAI
jgi:hypothetical protein